MTPRVGEQKSAKFLIYDMSKFAHLYPGATINRLFFAGRPFAITRLVALVIINAVKGKPFGWLAHIFKKIRETIPSFASFYSSATIILIVGVRWIVTALSHIYPAMIGWPSLNFIFGDVFLGSHTVGGQSMSTPAIIGVAIQKIPLRHFFLPSALTAKKPYLFRPNISSYLNCCQALPFSPNKCLYFSQIPISSHSGIIS